jgi:ribosome modulation factor
VAEGHVEDDPFQQGIDANSRGDGRSSCPHPRESAERTQWEAGWDEAEQKAQKVW